MQQSGIRVYKPRIAGRGLHPNMSLVLNNANKCALMCRANHLPNYICPRASSKRAKFQKQCPFFSRTGVLGTSLIFR